MCFACCLQIRNQRCHWRLRYCCSLSAVSLLKCPDGYCVFKARGLQSLKGFNHLVIRRLRELRGTTDNLYQTLHLQWAGLVTGTSSQLSVYVCMSVFPPVIPNKGTCFWVVAVETEVRLLSQCPYKHTRLHSFSGKQRRVGPTRMLNREAIGKAGGLMTNFHRITDLDCSGWKNKKTLTTKSNW